MNTEQGGLVGCEGRVVYHASKRMEAKRPAYDKALAEHREIIQTWHPQAQIWALTHGARIATFCVAGSSFVILIRMRQFFNLFSQQHLFGTILPCVVLPSVGQYISHDLFINRKIINEFNSPERSKSFCSTCLEIRGSVIQALLLRLKPIDCIDCLHVANHLLSEHLGLDSYNVDADKGLLTFNREIQSEIVSEVIGTLNASGIEASLETLDDQNCKTESPPPVKRLRPSQTEIDFVTDVNQLSAVLEPANWCPRGHNVPAWCATVDPLPQMSACILTLNRLKPLPKELGHLKRAFVKHLGSDRVGRVLLGLAEQSFTEEDAKDLAFQLCRESGVSEPTIESCQVPLCPPRSCRQQKALSSLARNAEGLQCWPFNFHPDQTLESLLSVGGLKDRWTESAKPYFSVEELRWHNHWLQRAVNLSRDACKVGRNASCDPEDPDTVCSCVVVYSSPAKGLDLKEAFPLAETSSNNAKFCIDHAAMLAAKLIGRSNLEHGERYLLNDCDVYLSIEPCLMCAMALLHSRVSRVFIAKRLPSIGGMCSRWKLSLVKAVNHHFFVFAPHSSSLQFE
ncbi:hypothetical protein Aperf_G00000024066 [Anoplocephala perfoliata]